MFCTQVGWVRAHAAEDDDEDDFELLFKQLAQVVPLGSSGHKFLTCLWDFFLKPVFGVVRQVLEAKVQSGLDGTKNQRDQKLRRVLYFLNHKAFRGEGSESHPWLTCAVWILSRKLLTTPFWDSPDVVKRTNCDADWDKIIDSLVLIERICAISCLLGKTVRQLTRMWRSVMLDLTRVAPSKWINILESHVSGLCQNEDIPEQISQLSYSNERERKLIKFFLHRLEFAHSLEDRSMFDVQLQNVSLEHVLPQDWKTHWDWAPDQAERARHHLGNLVLVSTRKNSALSNKAWSFKKQELSTEKELKWTREICQFEEWTFQTYLKRHEELVLRICNMLGVATDSRAAEEAVMERLQPKQKQRKVSFQSSIEGIAPLAKPDWIAVDKAISSALPGYKRVSVEGTSSCLFNALSLCSGEAAGREVTQSAVLSWIKQHALQDADVLKSIMQVLRQQGLITPEEDALVDPKECVDRYCASFADDESNMGGSAEMYALANMKGADIVLFHPSSSTPVCFEPVLGARKPGAPPLYLAYNGCDHYDAVLKRDAEEVARESFSFQSSVMDSPSVSSPIVKQEDLFSDLKQKFLDVARQFKPRWTIMKREQMFQLAKFEGMKVGRGISKEDLQNWLVKYYTEKGMLVLENFPNTPARELDILYEIAAKYGYYAKGALSRNDLVKLAAANGIPRSSRLTRSELSDSLQLIRPGPPPK